MPVLNSYVAAHFGEGLMQWLHASYGIGVTLGSNYHDHCPDNPEFVADGLSRGGWFPNYFGGLFCIDPFIMESKEYICRE